MLTELDEYVIDIYQKAPLKSGMGSIAMIGVPCKGGAFSVAESPTCQTFQQEAIGVS